MNSRKTRPGSEMSITLTMIWCQIDMWSICAHFGVVQSGFLLTFHIDNCLLKKFHYRMHLIHSNRENK
jgi:hypothetical protein